MGVLSSYMAKQGIDDVDQGMQKLVDDARKFHSKHRSENFDRYVGRKVALKRTHYCLPDRGDINKKHAE